MSFQNVWYIECDKSIQMQMKIKIKIFYLCISTSFSIYKCYSSTLYSYCLRWNCFYWFFSCDLIVGSTFSELLLFAIVFRRSTWSSKYFGYASLSKSNSKSKLENVKRYYCLYFTSKKRIFTSLQTWKINKNHKKCVSTLLF